MWVTILGGALAGVGYLVGTVLHELSHVAAVGLTGGTLERVVWRHTAVEYEPTSEYTDRLVKATPALLTPALAVAVYCSVASVWSAVFGAGLLLGFIPRDLTEYRVLTHL